MQADAHNVANLDFGSSMAFGVYQSSLNSNFNGNTVAEELQESNFPNPRSSLVVAETHQTSIYHSHGSSSVVEAH